MNPRLNVTQKTYYALGVLASVLNLAGGALYLAGIYAALLFNIASFLAGAMMLMTGACAGVKSLTGRLSLLAAALVVFSLMGGVPAKLGGALAWPCFAAPYWKKGEPLHTMVFLTFLAGGVQLVFSFVALPAALKACLAVVFAAVQLVLAYLLYCDQRDNAA
ncbi:hypothetical protein WMO24_13590 [Ruthenibacterium sp. CLA-JM-H11]|uniref:Uncharacterized protein n=1 Tax=Ruthenibacterium intestinale TaxID=3133163 RepID=A0ABV1GHX5_9FIRM